MNTPEYTIDDMPVFVARACHNCKFWKDVGMIKEDYGYCSNPIVEEKIMGGIQQPIRRDFGCSEFEVNDERT